MQKRRNQLSQLKGSGEGVPTADPILDAPPPPAGKIFKFEPLTTPPVTYKNPSWRIALRKEVSVHLYLYPLHPYIHTSYIHTSIYSSIHMYTCAHVHVHVYTYVHVHVHTHIPAYVHTHMHAYTHQCINCTVCGNFLQYFCPFERVDGEVASYIFHQVTLLYRAGNSACVCVDTTSKNN